MSNLKLPMMVPDDTRSSYIRLVVLLTCITLLYCTGLTIHRLLFHRLSKFPGPKLAAATFWYEYYYDVSRGGTYIWKIMDLHKQYGPVVRINPNEVHINDPEFFGEIYHSKNMKTDRDTFNNLEFLGEGIAFTIDHDIHAKRKGALSPYFSMQSIHALESRITSVVDHMSHRLHEVYEAGTMLQLEWLFAALSMDIVSEYAFGKSGSTNSMSMPDMGKWWCDIVHGQLRMNNFFRHFPIIPRILGSLPNRVTIVMQPSVAGFFAWQDMLADRVAKVLDGTDQSPEQTVIRDLANSSLPAEEKRASRLGDESSLLLGAGGETTATTLVRTTFHILNNPAVHKQLREELRTAIPVADSMPTLTELSKLPYLNAVIEEGLRISFPVLNRASRVFQDHNLQYKHWTIPAGASVSQSPYIILSSPVIFPDPFKFDPTRWLATNGSKAPVSSKYQVAFSKGRRVCMGVNLAYAELRCTLAVLFRRFELELFETTCRDVEVVSDCFLGMAAIGTNGVRVKVVGELK